MGTIGQVDLEDLGDENGGREGDKRETRRDRERRDKGDRQLVTRLTECFDRIAEALEGRGDDELAEVIREDAQVMAGGIMSLTRPFKPFRTFVLASVAVIEPALAFGRVLRVLAVRWSERRAAAAAAAAAEEGNGTPIPMPPGDFQ